MQVKTIALATAFALMSSVAFAQWGGGYAPGPGVPQGSAAAPIGSSATFGNGAMINRGPDATPGMDRDFGYGRSAYPGGPDRYRFGSEGTARYPRY